MEKGEAVKGQSLVTGMMTLSGVFASLLGGAVLDIGGPSQLLLISTILAIVGTISIFLTVNRV
jgi:PPP family 3-phenylpropionic acid transporter